MIEKMKFISITGPKSDIDRLVTTYLNKYEIHLENALAELNTVQDLRPFVEINPYREVLVKSHSMVKKLDSGLSASTKEITSDEAAAIIEQMHKAVDELNVKKRALKDERNHLRDLMHQIEPFRLLNYDLRKILHFKFIKYRFGRISHEYFNKFSQYIYGNLNTVFYECDRDRDYVWGVYFAPASSAVQVDAIYSSLHFERIMIPDEYEGTPEEAYQTMKAHLSNVEAEIKQVYAEIAEKLNSNGSDILLANKTLEEHNKNFDIRKVAALTSERKDNEVFYILCGWMSKDDANAFIEDTTNDDLVMVITDSDTKEQVTTKPPTKLSNPKLFKPFELFVKMYGLPAYNEFDPTIFVALTYSFIFGAMFGDVGQGLCLVIGGYLFNRFKNSNLGAIVSLAGIFSTFFGFMYGSFFGYEHVLKTYWLKPMDNVMTVLMVSVAFGAVIILISMILNIINSIKSNDVEKLFFDNNGIAGLIFYGGAIGCVVAIFTGHALPGTIVLSVLFGLPFLAIFLKEPLANWVEKKPELIHGSKGMFFVESLVEMFDVLLSYATNTISFLRVGAFALSHAGMMGVVLMLAGAETGNTNFIVIILGNILVAGMEGLIVGIQVLRLEYYEMFGRFYRGTGKEFKAFKETNNK